MKQRLGDDTVQSCPVHIRAFFIGGAADAVKFKALRFAPRVFGPTHIMGYVKNESDARLRDIVANHDYQSYYHGYEDFHPEDREDVFTPDAQIGTVVESRIPTRDTAVYVIGHSLGATNGVHVVLHLLRKGFNVVMLVTLDPVSGINLYRVYEARTPQHSGPFEWINISARSDLKDGSDGVAGAGAPWDLSGASSVDVNVLRNLHHGEARRMFFEGTPSPFERMSDSIAEYIRTTCRK
ncbi:hypothetical protein WMF26_24955 [Sorangium sp. So ce185]|uniref:hypothetical protein n=1 Tax=Sorangium sp. So ce185 TaxID=3133287 RepID=UPI003F627E7A